MVDMKTLIAINTDLDERVKKVLVEREPLSLAEVELELGARYGVGGLRIRKRFGLWVERFPDLLRLTNKELIFIGGD